MLGKIENNELVGLIGISYLTEDEVELRHMAVKSNKRRLGLGKKLIRDFINENLIKKMEAETDKDAVDFYRKIGFQIMSLGEKYPGVERFKCILTKD
ncbi:acetyltransferase [compost metagenome]